MEYELLCSYGDIKKGEKVIIQGTHYFKWLVWCRDLKRTTLFSVDKKDLKEVKED